MTRYTTSAPDRWTDPRRVLTPDERRKYHGPIVPMEQPAPRWAFWKKS